MVRKQAELERLFSADIDQLLAGEQPAARPELDTEAKRCALRLSSIGASVNKAPAGVIVVALNADGNGRPHVKSAQLSDGETDHQKTRTFAGIR